jgi:hypothetical protein
VDPLHRRRGDDRLFGAGLEGREHGAHRIVGDGARAAHHRDLLVALLQADAGEHMVRRVEVRKARGERRVQSVRQRGRPRKTDALRGAHRVRRERRDLVWGAAVDRAEGDADVRDAAHPDHRVHRLAVQHGVRDHGHRAVRAEHTERAAEHRGVVREIGDRRG